MYAERFCYEFKAALISVLFKFTFQSAKVDLLPRRSLPVMSPDEGARQSVELGVASAVTAGAAVKEVADVQEGNNDKVERSEADVFHGECTIAIALISTLYLNPDLSLLAISGLMSWIRVDANQVVAFVIWWGFVGQDVSSHEMAHDEEIRTS